MQMFTQSLCQCELQKYPLAILTSRWSDLQHILTFKSTQAKTISNSTHGPRHHPPALYSTGVPTAITQQVTQMTSQPWEPSSSCLWCHLSLQHPDQNLCCPSSLAPRLHAIPSFSGLNRWGRTDTFFTVRVVKHWKWLSKEAVVSPPSLEIHKISLDKTSGNLI